MKIPHSLRKKALLVVDVQDSFLNRRNKSVVKAIIELLASTKYSAYAEATFHAEKGSLWDIQQNWTCPKGKMTRTINRLSKAFKPFRPIRVEKVTKSLFKGNKEVVSFLKSKGISEVHIVGLDTNDCILATAYEAFDLGFITYVIEECCQSSASNRMHTIALELLRRQNMTNHSVCI